jgi:hypothetical protein
MTLGKRQFQTLSFFKQEKKLPIHIGTRPLESMGSAPESQVELLAALWLIPLSDNSSLWTISSILITGI